VKVKTHPGEVIAEMSTSPGGRGDSGELKKDAGRRSKKESRLEAKRKRTQGKKGGVRGAGSSNSGPGEKELIRKNFVVITGIIEEETRETCFGLDSNIERAWD